MHVALPTQRRPHGFTLIEAMIAVAVVAILSALAYPNYVEFITRSRIIEGTSKMSNFRVQLEQFFMDNRTYLNPLGTACGIPNQPAGAKEYFGVSALCTATTYVITGQGVSSMSNFTYTVNELNARQTTSANAGWNIAGSTCWVTKKDGTC